ncbi:PepSY-associated TM helix domain-containing protein [Shewanella frigidimarina]|uniref:PepSY-associated TM helix domain-containing protein n=1 Tax=Shewanella frigidimarina TaxID=56812 RepID=UPI000F514FC6|nr:PepSY-associated TM helix domain-containing protein [Shewanella frigidimarina]RPA33699.1 PepSY domain-containing protein [Shewanella frigidimarina]
MRVRGDILRTYQSIHTWTGIIAGLVLFIGFYAGSLTMFKDEITQWATPPSHQLPQVPKDQFDQLILQASTNFDKAQQSFTVNFNQQLSPLTWFEQGGGRGLHLNNVMRHATLSDEGELVTQVNPTNELGELIDMLHRTAGIAGKAGHEDIGVLVLGGASVLYFLALVSGVIFLLPTLVNSFLAIRKNKGVNRFWLDSHNLVGIISLPFHLIIAWTVIVFAFHDVLYGGLSLVYGDEPMFDRGERSTIEYSIEQLPPISSYLQKVNEMTDGYHVESMAFSDLSTTNPMVGITIINEREMMRVNSGDFIYMNPYTFDVGYSSIPLKDNDIYTPLVASFFSLHFGGYAGDLGRWVYFSLGLLGAFLFYSGNLLWLEKRRQKQPLQNKSSRFMASLTVGMCLGSILAVMITMLSSKWLYLISDQVNNNYLICYYVVFFSALIYSFVVGAAKSAIYLQYLLFVACLLIPITSVVSFIMPGIGLWGPIYFPSMVVEFIALVFAGVFYYGAIKTKQRVYYGERNSIWALPLTTATE